MSKGRIWVTRTEPGASKSAARYRDLGFETVVAPLLTLGPAYKAPPPLPKNAILVLTSANTLRFLGEFTDQRHWPVVTVGDATASAAREYGFARVISATGTWEDVVSTLKEAFAKTDRPIIHASGGHVRGQITERLRAAGYEAERHVYYQSHPVTHMPDMDLRDLTHIALYSPLAARTLAGFSANLAHITALSISAATDAKLGEFPFKRRIIADAPNEDRMITALEA